LSTKVVTFSSFSSASASLTRRSKREEAMNKIETEHLPRTAYVYVRQSTPGHLTNNPESRRRQYGLKDRAYALGRQNVVVIDDDLGHTASETERLGFEQLLTAVCINTAGAVFAIEASRLARNGRDWRTLLEFCGLVNCLIIVEDGVYDPKQANDRFLLRMKGVYSKLELSVLRQRSQEALRVKAARAISIEPSLWGICAALTTESKWIQMNKFRMPFT
jgi:DNA invertase Pin-like site-specific DNA recombinase